ncbi:hypothetical protein PS2_033955 [Malus domestica]
MVQNNGISSKKHDGPINNERHSPSQQTETAATKGSDNAAAATGDPFLGDGRQCIGYTVVMVSSGAQ